MNIRLGFGSHRATATVVGGGALARHEPVGIVIPATVHAKRIRALSIAVTPLGALRSYGRARAVWGTAILPADKGPKISVIVGGNDDSIGQSAIADVLVPALEPFTWAPDAGFTIPPGLPFAVYVSGVYYSDGGPTPRAVTSIVSVAVDGENIAPTVTNFTLR